MLPAGIIARELQVGPAYDLASGVPLTIRVMIQPSRILVWNGTPAVPKLATYTFLPEEVGSIILPVTDQPGYTTTRGEPVEAGPGVHSHYYKISIFYLNGASVSETAIPIKAVMPTDDLSVVDIDTLISFESGTPAGSIYIPDSWTEQIEGIPALIDDTMNEWVADTDLPTTRTDIGVIGWPAFVILEHNTDSASIPDGTFIVRLPEGWTP